MLEIAWVGSVITASLKKVLKRVKLLRIKTLILPPTPHPLLRHCHNVEDIVCVVGGGAIISDVFLGSIESNRDSKIKRLAIPLTLRPSPSRKQSSTLYDRRLRMVTNRLPQTSGTVASRSRLIELTVISPYTYDAGITKSEVHPNPAARVLPEISELVFVCEAPPDLDTFQVLYFLPLPPLSI